MPRHSTSVSGLDVITPDIHTYLGFSQLIGTTGATLNLRPNSANLNSGDPLTIHRDCSMVDLSSNHSLSMEINTPSSSTPMASVWIPNHAIQFCSEVNIISYELLQIQLFHVSS